MKLKIIDNLWKCLETTEKELSGNPCFDLQTYMIIIANELGVKIPNYDNIDMHVWKCLISEKIEKLMNKELVSEPFMIKAIVGVINDHMRNFKDATIRDLQILLSNFKDINEKAIDPSNEVFAKLCDPLISLNADDMIKCWERNVSKYLNKTVYDLYVSDYGWPILRSKR